VDIGVRHGKGRHRQIEAFGDIQLFVHMRWRMQVWKYYIGSIDLMERMNGRSW
jgi:hypothetical protein